MKKYIMRFDETLDETFGLHAISLVNDGAMKQMYVTLSAEEIVRLSTEKKGIVTGALMVPGLEIERAGKDGAEPYLISFPAETIEAASHDFMKNNRNQSVTVQHSLGVEDVYLTEMWIKEDETHDKSVALGIDAPVGSLMVSLKVDNKEVREELVDTGLLKAFSLEGKFKPELQEVQLSTQKTKDMACPDNEIKGDSIIDQIKKLVNGVSAETVELKVEETVELAEDEVAHVSKWYETVESYEVKDGEQIKLTPYEGQEGDRYLSAGEYETKGGEKFLVDSEGIIRHIFETVDEKEEEVATEAAAEADGESKEEAEEKAAEEVAASSEEEKVETKPETIAEVKEELEKKEEPTMLAHTDAERPSRKAPLKFDKKLTVQERIQAQLHANKN